MTIIMDDYNGDLVIENYIEIMGDITGKVLVKRGGRLALHGVISNNVFLEEGASVFIQKDAQVNGEVINNGGKLYIYGSIYGKVLNKSGKVIVGKHAFISG